jgi:hypothetical protein
MEVAAPNVALELGFRRAKKKKKEKKKQTVKLKLLTNAMGR